MKVRQSGAAPGAAVLNVVALAALATLVAVDVPWWGRLGLLVVGTVTGYLGFRARMLDAGPGGRRR